MKRNFLVRVGSSLVVGLIALIMFGCEEFIREIASRPGTPLFVVAAPVSSTSITITWLSAYGAESYNVYSITGGSSISKLGNTKETSYTHEGLTPETAYTYHVRAVNSSGEGEASTSSTGTTFAAAAANGKTADDAITITAGGVTGTLLRGSSEQWFTFTKTGSGTLSVQDSGNSTYTANIVIDILDSSQEVVTIDGRKAEDLDMGRKNLNTFSSNNWSGTYYVLVKLYDTDSLTGGTFRLSFE